MLNFQGQEFGGGRKQEQPQAGLRQGPHEHRQGKGGLVSVL